MATDSCGRVCNDPVGPYVLDFHWPEHRFAVEIDGRGSHLTPAAFENDRARDAYLWGTRRIHVTRFTYLQVTRGRAVVLQRLSEALEAPNPARSTRFLLPEEERRRTRG